MNKSEIIKEFEKEVAEKIIGTYPPDIWLPISDEQKARDAVAAQLLRDMAPALARMSVEIFENNLDSYEYQLRESIAKELEMLEKDGLGMPEAKVYFRGIADAANLIRKV